MNVKIMIVAVAIVAAIILAGVGIAEGKPTRGVTRVPPQPIKPMLYEITDLLATPHQPTAADVQLEWSEVDSAGSYNIYRSASVRGDGFNFSNPYTSVPMTGTGKIIWVDVGTYAAMSDYSWVVRPVVGGTELPNNSNMAWKRIHIFRSGSGIAGAEQNYISLPARLNITNGAYVNDAAALIKDIRTYGAPMNGVQSVQRWNQSTSLWSVRTAVVGTNFKLMPGEGYRVIGTMASVQYKMVGADDPAFSHSLFMGTGPYGADQTFISLPYHYSFDTDTALGLIRSLRTDGSPANSVVTVARWNQDTSVWESRINFAGTDFALTPGECYRVTVKDVAVAWTCPVAEV